MGKYGMCNQRSDPRHRLQREFKLQTRNWSLEISNTMFWNELVCISSVCSMYVTCPAYAYLSLAQLEATKWHWIVNISSGWGCSLSHCFEWDVDSREHPCPFSCAAGCLSIPYLCALGGGLGPLPSVCCSMNEQGTNILWLHFFFITIWMSHCITAKSPVSTQKGWLNYNHIGLINL